MNSIPHWKWRPAHRSGSWWFPVFSGITGMCRCRVCRLFLHQDSQDFDSSNVVHLTGTALGVNTHLSLGPYAGDHPQVTGGSRSRELSAQLLSRSPQDCCLPTLPALHPRPGSPKRELPGENVRHLTLVPWFHVEAWHLRNVGRRRADFCGGRLKRNYKVSTFFAPRYPSFQATPTAPTPTKHPLSARFPIYEQKASVLSATLREFYIMTARSYLPRGHLRRVGTSMWDVNVSDGAKGERVSLEFYTGVAVSKNGQC